jgi:hypothetical protein
MVNASSPTASSLLFASFVALALVVAAAFVAGVARSRAATPSGRGSHRDTVIAAVGTAAWLGVTLALAASGRLSFTAKPPTMLLLVAFAVVLAIVLGVSRVGLRLATGLPLAALVGVQAFRFPLELILHRAYVEGLMPVQMSFSGLNFDILSGLSAIVVALALVRKPDSLVLVRVWNTAGVVLLANIVTIALLSAPTPLRVFHNEPANVWITRAPWVWLPTVFVFAAILGHIVVFRRIRHELSSTVRSAVASRHASVIAR